MIDIELQRARSAMAESVTLPIATWLEVLDELEALRQVEPVKQEPVLFDKWDVDEAKSLLPAMRQGVALLEYVAGVLPKSTEPVKQEPVAWKHDCAALLMNGVELWIDQCPHCGKPRHYAPVDMPQAEPTSVDAKAILECRNPKADEVRAYRDEHSVSMKQAYEKVKLQLNAKAEKAGIKFTGGFVRVAECVTEDELLELSKAIRAEALEEANDLLDKIESWAKAYPLSVFPEPDFAKAHKVLTENGMTLDAISASNMRHVLSQLQKMIDDCAAAIRARSDVS